MNDLKTTKTDWSQIPLQGKGDRIDAFIAEPSGPPRGSLVMLQEIFGVNEAMREKARDFASAGFLVVVPDLFWRLQRRVDLSYSEGERKQGFGLMQKFDQATGAADVRDVISWLRKRSGHKVGVVGFCLGGRMAVLASANNPDVAAVVSFYGVRLDLCAEQLRALNAPFRFYVGDRDEHVPADHITAVRGALANATDADVRVYPGAKHGFFNRLREDVYSHDAAADARNRVLSLLAEVGA